MYAEDVRETDTKIITITNGKLKLESFENPHTLFYLRREFSLGQTTFKVYAPYSMAIGAVNDLIDLNHHAFKSWSRFPIQ